MVNFKYYFGTMIVVLIIGFGLKELVATPEGQKATVLYISGKTHEDREALSKRFTWDGYICDYKVKDKMVIVQINQGEAKALKKVLKKNGFHVEIQNIGWSHRL